jgi:hypothetical protein
MILEMSFAGTLVKPEREISFLRHRSSVKADLVGRLDKTTGSKQTPLTSGPASTVAPCNARNFAHLVQNVKILSKQYHVGKALSRGQF